MAVDISSGVNSGLPQQEAAGSVPVQMSDSPQQEAAGLNPEAVVPSFATFP